ncbi:MAG TPA: FecR domain-containing protein [Povalibacter sp.]|nr:FecR domain-containing protein [Povalibacter sp.]
MSIRHSTNDSSRAGAAQAAAEWLAVLADDDSEEQRTAFLAWLRASTLHVEEFLRLSALERRLRQPGLWPSDPVDQLIATARQSSSNSEIAQLHAATPPPANSKRHLIQALAAGVVLAVVAAGAFIAQRWRPAEPEAITYATAVGEQRSVTLPDSSVVELNSRSKLQIRFTDSERRVQLLDGEAIFKVAKNPQRPFRVSVGSTDIVAVGTAFNVDAHGAQTVVTVLEGRVRVSDHPAAADAMRIEAPAGPIVELNRGEQVVIAGDRSHSKVEPVDPAKVIAWTQRRLIFENTPLEAVAEQFARYHTRIIRVNNDALRERRITGVFDAHDPASLIEFLRTDRGITIEADEQGWKLSSSDLHIGTAAAERQH